MLGGRLGHELLNKIIHFVLILQSTLDPGFACCCGVVAPHNIAPPFEPAPKQSKARVKRAFFVLGGRLELPTSSSSGKRSTN